MKTFQTLLLSAFVMDVSYKDDHFHKLLVSFLIIKL